MGRPTTSLGNLFQCFAVLMVLMVCFVRLSIIQNFETGAARKLYCL